MDKDIISLPNLILSKEVRTMLASLDSKYSKMNDLSKIFSTLFEEGRISEQELKFYKTKFLCLKLSSQIERKFNNTAFAIYIYEVTNMLAGIFQRLLFLQKLINSQMVAGLNLHLK